MKDPVTIEPGWLPKDKAAKLLGVSIRQLEHRTSKGEIRKNTLPRQLNERAARVLYSIEDIEAIRAGRPNHHGATETQANADAEPKTALAVAPAPADPFAGLAAHLAALSRAFPAPTERRSWLTLAEAEAVSGLTRKWLLTQAEAGRNDEITVRDMGKHARGGRWRFLRKSLIT